MQQKRHQTLKRERTELGELVQQAEALHTENAALHRRSMRLPGLQEENERLKVRCVRVRMHACMHTCVCMAVGSGVLPS